MIKICLNFGRRGYSLGDYVGLDCFGAGYTSRYKYFIVLSHVSGVLLFGGKINYFGGIGYPPPVNFYPTAMHSADVSFKAKPETELTPCAEI